MDVRLVNLKTIPLFITLLRNDKMARGRAWRRYKNYIKAKRKRDIDFDIYGWSQYFHPWYNNLHQYSKNKIHCSCPMCSPKTRNKGKRRKRWAPSIDYTMMDKRQQMRMMIDEEEYFNNEN